MDEMVCIKDRPWEKGRKRKAGWEVRRMQEEGDLFGEKLETGV